MPLLYALRNDIGLHGPRFGCGLAQCGACTVHIGGRPVRSCDYPLSKAAGRKVVTIESLGKSGKLHPLQQALIEEQAAQCGYCINGMIMQAKALLDRDVPDRPSQIQVTLVTADLAQLPKEAAHPGHIHQALRNSVRRAEYQGNRTLARRNTFQAVLDSKP